MSGWSPGRLSLAGSEPDLFDNPASGSQGSILRDGEIVGWDLHPGGTPWEDDGPLEVFFPASTGTTRWPTPAPMRAYG